MIEVRHEVKVARLRLALALLLIASACASASRWHVRDRPTDEDVGLLLASPGAAECIEPIHRSEVPNIPMRKRLRPCCAFGSEIGVRLGPIPIPGFRLPNVIGVDDLGPHVYDSGLVVVRPPGSGVPDAIGRERNGLVYTCRGGFVDTAHLRDYVDWATFLGAQIAVLSCAGGVIELPDQGGRPRLRLRALPSEGELPPQRLLAALAQWASFQLSIWHEIATWYGWSEIELFPERASAFSPEDLYSNLLGVRLVGAIVARNEGRNEELYNRSVDAWMRRELVYLGAVPRQVGREASRALDGLWWDSSARLPDAGVVLRRNLDIGPRLEPWLVPEAVRSPQLRAALDRHCGARAEPEAIANPDSLDGWVFADWLTLEVEVDDALAAQEPFARLGRVVSQRDFPRIVDEIRRQVHAEFGPDADRIQ